MPLSFNWEEWCRGKVVDNVIRAIGKLKKTLQPVKLVIVGGEHESADLYQDPEVMRLQSIAESEGVSDSILFAGRKNRAHEAKRN
jgi:glycosyltransferase involved in cell wall biosynthesis